MTYQDQVAAWMSECFPPEAGTDVFERSHRFLEESLELVQASGCTKDDAVAIINYVYDRPAGSLEQEVGGVMVTLAALCGALGISMDDASNNELARNWQRIEVIRHKQATKPVGSPLPQHVEKSLHVSVAG